MSKNKMTDKIKYFSNFQNLLAKLLNKMINLSKILGKSIKNMKSRKPKY